MKKNKIEKNFVSSNSLKVKANSLLSKIVNLGELPSNPKLPSSTGNNQPMSSDYYLACTTVNGEKICVICYTFFSTVYNAYVRRCYSTYQNMVGEQVLHH